jgi:hypothetical protein
MYKLQLFGGVVAPFAAFVWGNHAPSKVQFFGWLLTRGRVPSHSSLLRNNILTRAEAVYPIFAAPEETADHLFAGCIFARSFWDAVGSGPPLLPPSAGSYARADCSDVLPALLLETLETPKRGGFPCPESESGSPDAPMP